MLHKAWNIKGEMPYCFPRSSIKFQGHTGQNITDFDLNWAFPDCRPVAAFKSLRFALFLYENVTSVGIWREIVICILCRDREILLFRTWIREIATFNREIMMLTL